MKPSADPVARRRALPPVALHPVLFSLYAVLALLATNMLEMDIGEAYRSVAVAVALAIILLLVLWLVVRDGLKAGLLASLYLLGFYAYGHVYTVLKAISIGGAVVGRHRFLAPALAAMLVIGTIAILRTRRDLGGLTRVLNIVGTLALVAPAITMGATWLESGTAPWPEGEPAEAISDFEPASPESLPDIYYILVDSYAGSEMLRDRFEYDNSSFEAYLTGQGFYIATHSQSNYAHTALSAASSLNMDYLHHLPVNLDRGHYPENLQEAILHSVVRRDLEALGYTVVAFPTGYGPTELTDADLYLTQEETAVDRLELAGEVNAFEAMLFTSTAGRLLVDLDGMLDTPLGSFLAERLAARQVLQREIILSTFDHLTRVAEIPGPKFVFAHVTTPHRPYFFAADGAELMTSGAFTFDTPTVETSWREEIPSYIGQLVYTNSRVEEVIDAILARSKTRPIILLQSDHGPDVGNDWETPDAQTLRARVSILNAYYLPPECGLGLQPDTSPVNSFRVVFNCILGPVYPLLDNVAYYSTIGQPSWDTLRPVEEWLREMEAGGG